MAMLEPGVFVNCWIEATLLLLNGREVWFALCCFLFDCCTFLGVRQWRPQTMMATNHDGHKPWRPQTMTATDMFSEDGSTLNSLWIWQFLKSTPLVLEVFIAVAVNPSWYTLWPSSFVAIMVVAIMVYGHRDIGLFSLLDLVWTWFLRKSLLRLFQ